MKRIKMFFVSILATTCLFANLSIAVIDFDVGGHITEQEAVVITNLFRNELIRSGRADVADRGNMDRILAEMQFQMSDWAEPTKIKQVGKMVGADYLITGRLDMLGNNLNLIVQMLDIETARAINSSRITLRNIEEFDARVKQFADEFIQKLPAENILTGTWVAEIIHSAVNDRNSINRKVVHTDIIDVYTITFGTNNRCNIHISSFINGQELIEYVQGSYTYDGSILKINAVLRNSKIPHIGTIQWTSVIAMSRDNSSFNKSIRPNRGSNQQVRASFIKQ
jgi:TolB-like protein